MSLSPIFTTILLLFAFVVVVLFGVNYLKPPAIPLAAVAEFITPVPTSTTHFKITDTAVSPTAITISAGTAVTWINTGKDPHQIVGDTFTSPVLQPGESYMHSFISAGIYTFSSNSNSTKEGTITVVMKS